MKLYDDNDRMCHLYYACVKCSICWRNQAIQPFAVTVEALLKDFDTALNNIIL